MAVVGVAGKAAGTDSKACVKGGGEADLGAEFVTDAGLALGDAVHVGFVQGVDLVLALRRLLEQAADQPERLQHPSARRTFGNVLQVAPPLTAHPADIALELAQGLSHALELPRVGMSRRPGQPVAEQGA